MKRLISRILLIADPHYMVVPPEEQKGQIIKGIDQIIEGWLIRGWKEKNNFNFSRAIQALRSGKVYNSVILLGDLIECVYNERGIFTVQDIETAKELLVIIKNTLTLTGEIHYVPGDHELGYKLPLSLDPDGGLNEASVANFERLGDKLFSFWQIENFHFLTVSSSLFIQNTEHLECAARRQIETLRRKQMNFLISYLNFKIPDEHMAFLFLHDPDAIETIDKLPGAQKITKIFCGHMHEEKTLKSYVRLGKIANSFWGRTLLFTLGLAVNRLERARRIIKWARGNLYRASLFEKYKLEIVPAISGMLGSGAGCKILNLFDDGSFEVVRRE